MVKQTITFSWRQHSAFSATLLTEEDSQIPAKENICFSKDGQFARNTNQANDLQKKIGEALQTLDCDKFPLIRKVVFNSAGITIYKTQFKTWEIACAITQVAISKILKEAEIEAAFTNGY